VHLNPCVASAVHEGAWVCSATMGAVKHVSQIAPLTGEANCRARHQRNVLAGSAFVAYSLLRLGLQVGVYSYSAACDHHPLFPRLIAPLLHDDLMVTCRHTHNRCRVAHEISIYFDFRIRGRGRQVQFAPETRLESALALISPSVQRSASALMDMTITVTALGAVL
jgi:hypothetical protein